MLKIVERTKLWFAISIAVIVIGLVGLVVNGLNLGIDFQGGTMVSIGIGKDYSIEEVRNLVSKYDPQAQVQPVEGNEVSIRSNTMNDAQVQEMFNDFKSKYQLDDKALISTNRIGPAIGNEMKKSAFLASMLAVVLIMVYVTIRFEFSTGTAAVAALIHDVLVTIAVYALFKIPVNNSFIAAILTILGYSINDTIVIFDRIRENKKMGRYSGDTAMLVNASITQTLARSINTALTTLITITSIYIIGVPAVKEFAFPLIIGIISGGYSTIFIASPIWMMLEKRKKAHA